MSETTTTLPAPAPAPTNGDTTAPAASPATPATPQALATAKAALSVPPVVKFDPDNPIDMYMDSGVFGQLQRVGRLMAESALVPDYLKGKIADCVLVAAQAFRWRMDPFAVAAHTFVYQGKLGYEGKLVAAVVNTHSDCERRLNYKYTGDKGTDRRGVIVIGRLKGETEDRTVEGDVAGWKTANTKWKEMPDQMLAYRGAREWARRHMPEALLGVSADEEVEPIDMVVGPGGAFAPRVAETLDEAAAQLVSKTEASATATATPPAAPTAPPTAPAKERVVGEDDDEPSATQPVQPAKPAAAEDKKPRQGRLA